MFRRAPNAFGASASLLSGPILGFDTETTGVSVATDRIVSLSLVMFRGRECVASWSHLIDPGVEIPQGATDVHGITTEQARADGAMPVVVLAKVVAGLAAHLKAGHPVIGFNVSFDLTLLDVECRRHGLPTLTDRLGNVPSPVLDAYVLDKRLDRYRTGRRRLTDVAATYAVHLGNAHDACEDATAAVGIVLAMSDRYQRFFDQHSLDELHAEQVRWRFEQQAGLRDYFDRQHIDHDGCDGGWPIQAVRTAKRSAARPASGHPASPGPRLVRPRGPSPFVSHPPATINVPTTLPRPRSELTAPGARTHELQPLPRR